jgi:hypothetical protein
MVMYCVRYVFDIDILLIYSDTRIGKVSIKSLFLNKKIISDTLSIRPDIRFGKILVKFLLLNKIIIPDMCPVRRLFFE